VRIILDVEKITGPQVGVTICNPCVDARRVDADLHSGIVGISLVDVNGCGEALESAANGGEHHVLDRELDRRVRRVDLPNRCVVHLNLRWLMRVDSHLDKRRRTISLDHTAGKDGAGVFTLSAQMSWMSIGRINTRHRRGLRPHARAIFIEKDV
jgi:hypothetical protein